jgi:hypothetical protein
MAGRHRARGRVLSARTTMRPGALKVSGPPVVRSTLAGVAVLVAAVAMFGRVSPPDPPEVRQVVVPAAVVSLGTAGPGHCVGTR